MSTKNQKAWAGGKPARPAFPGDLAPVEDGVYVARLVRGYLYWNPRFGVDISKVDVSGIAGRMEFCELMVGLSMLVDDPESTAEPFDKETGLYRYEQQFFKLVVDENDRYGLAGPKSILTQVFQSLYGKSFVVADTELAIWGDDLQLYEDIYDIPLLSDYKKDGNGPVAGKPLLELDTILIDAGDGRKVNLIDRECQIQFGYPEFNGKKSERLKIVGAMPIPPSLRRRRPEPVNEEPDEDEEEAPAPRRAAKAKPAAPATEEEAPPKKRRTTAAAAAQKAEAQKAASAKRRDDEEPFDPTPPRRVARKAIDPDSLPKHLAYVVKQLVKPPLNIREDQWEGYLDFFSQENGGPALVELTDLDEEMAELFRTFWKGGDEGREVLVGWYRDWRREVTGAGRAKATQPEPEANPWGDDDDDEGEDDKPQPRKVVKKAKPAPSTEDDDVEDVDEDDLPW